MNVLGDIDSSIYSPTALGDINNKVSAFALDIPLPKQQPFPGKLPPDPNPLPPGSGKLLPEFPRLPPGTPSPGSVAIDWILQGAIGSAPSRVGHGNIDYYMPDGTILTVNSEGTIVAVGKYTPPIGGGPPPGVEPLQPHDPFPKPVEPTDPVFTPTPRENPPAYPGEPPVKPTPKPPEPPPGRWGPPKGTIPEKPPFSPWPGPDPNPPSGGKPGGGTCAPPDIPNIALAAVFWTQLVFDIRRATIEVAGFLEKCMIAVGKLLAQAIKMRSIIRSAKNYLDGLKDLIDSLIRTCDMSDACLQQAQDLSNLLDNASQELDVQLANAQNTTDKLAKYDCKSGNDSSIADLITPAPRSERGLGGGTEQGPGEFGPNPPGLARNVQNLMNFVNTLNSTLDGFHSAVKDFMNACACPCKPKKKVPVIKPPFGKGCRIDEFEVLDKVPGPNGELVVIRRCIPKNPLSVE